jgi:hypothetical protein
MNSTTELGDLSDFSPVLQEWLRLQVERAEREPEWHLCAPLPPGSTIEDTIRVSGWLLVRFRERIRRRREAESLHDIPEFVL